MAAEAAPQLAQGQPVVCNDDSGQSWAALYVAGFNTSAFVLKNDDLSLCQVHVGNLTPAAAGTPAPVLQELLQYIDINVLQDCCDAAWKFKGVHRRSDGSCWEANITGKIPGKNKYVKERVATASSAPVAAILFNAAARRLGVVKGFNFEGNMGLPAKVASHLGSTLAAMEATANPRAGARFRLVKGCERATESPAAAREAAAGEAAGSQQQQQQQHTSEGYASPKRQRTTGKVFIANPSRTQSQLQRQHLSTTPGNPSLAAAAAAGAWRSGRHITLSSHNSSKPEPLSRGGLGGSAPVTAQQVVQQQQQQQQRHAQLGVAGLRNNPAARFTLTNPAVSHQQPGNLAACWNPYGHQQCCHCNCHPDGAVPRFLEQRQQFAAAAPQQPQVQHQVMLPTSSKQQQQQPDQWQPPTPQPSPAHQHMSQPLQQQQQQQQPVQWPPKNHHAPPLGQENVQPLQQQQQQQQQQQPPNNQQLCIVNVANQHQQYQAGTPGMGMSVAPVAAPTAAAAAAASNAVGPPLALPPSPTNPLMHAAVTITKQHDAMLGAAAAAGSIILEEFVAAGGFASVYVGSYIAAANAEQAAAAPSSMRVAVKVYRASVGHMQREVLAGYAAREIRALQLLHGQPNVVQLLAEGVVVDSTGQHHTCAVLELAPVTLGGKVKDNGPCPEGLTKWYMRYLLQLLDVMHSGVLGAVVVHRDIKAANVLIRGDGTLALADFGCCSILAGPSSNSGATGSAGPQSPAAAAAAAAGPMQSFVGSPYFVPPEMVDVARAKKAALVYNQPYQGPVLDCSMDVYSAGVMLLELLVGGLLRLGHGVLQTTKNIMAWQDTVRAIVDGEFQLPAGLVLSEGARQFIGCCCGVGQQREAAAARGEAKRLTPQQLLDLPWLKSLV